MYFVTALMSAVWLGLVATDETGARGPCVLATAWLFELWESLVVACFDCVRCAVGGREHVFK